MTALEDRRQRANETFWNREPHGTMTAVDDAIESATRAQITDKMISAYMGAAQMAVRGSSPGIREEIEIVAGLRAAFEAAGFEVVK